MIDLFVSGALLLLIDGWTKRSIAVNPRGGVQLGPLLQLRRVATVRRRFTSHSIRTTLVLLWFAALASSLALIQSGTAFQSRAALIGIGAALGGAAGNLIEMVRSQYVTDFIDFKFWPAFNVADVGIVCGLIAALIFK